MTARTEYRKPYDRALFALEERNRESQRAQTSYIRSRAGQGYYVRIWGADLFVGRAGSSWEVRDGATVVARARTRREAVERAIVELLAERFAREDAAHDDGEDIHCHDCGELIDSASRGCESAQCAGDLARPMTPEERAKRTIAEVHDGASTNYSALALRRFAGYVRGAVNTLSSAGETVFPVDKLVTMTLLDFDMVRAVTPLIAGENGLQIDADGNLREPAKDRETDGNLCIECGGVIEDSGSTDTPGSLCRTCQDRAELEMEHDGGEHDDRPHPDCKECRELARDADTRSVNAVIKRALADAADWASRNGRCLAEDIAEQINAVELEVGVDGVAFTRQAGGAFYWLADDRVLEILERLGYRGADR